MCWRSIQRKNFVQKELLCDFLELDLALRNKVLIRPSFPLNLPLRLAAKISKNTLEDPILRQFVPLNEETFHSLGFLADPVQDAHFCKTQKLLHKYQGRALLVCTSACAMHCRYCFRQNFDYSKGSSSGFQKELELIAQDKSLSEILLSGGDPLSLSNETLQKLIENLAAIAHIQRVRIHTRFPIGIPERLEEALLDIFTSTRLQIWMVIHCNHPRELDQEVLDALTRVRKRGIPILNQAVLLKGVNDSAQVLTELSEALINHGIQPYYLHQLDRVQGAAHFEVPIEQGILIIEQMQKVLPGYAVPRYVQELAGHTGKTTIV